MNISSLENTPVRTPAIPLVGLAQPHGYRLDGDTAHLHARLTVLAPAAYERAWALQLWACPSAPTRAQELAGHLVAEIALPPLAEIADQAEPFHFMTFAWPPAGQQEQVMALVLASGAPGQFHLIHDLAVYPCHQQFIQPRMSGAIDYRLEGGRAHLSVQRVENPRPAGNQSGTLSLELWALSVPFTGGDFVGHHLAGVEIGSLSGQGELTPPPFDLAFVPPPPGDWQLVLMLREWAGGGFLTRDFTNFATRFVWPPAPSAPMPTVETPAAAVIPEETTGAVAQAPTAPRVEVVPPVASAQPMPVVSDPRVSVNTARLEELIAVKGLSKKIAEGIIKQRPFASLDDLNRVRRLSEKHLEKLRSCLRV